MEGGAALLVTAEVLIVCASIVFRYVLKSPLVWSNELAQLLLVWLSFLGALIAYRRGSDLRVTYVLERSAALRGWFEPAGALIVVAFGGMLAAIGTPAALDAGIEFSPALGLPETVYLAAVPVFGVLLAVFGLSRLLGMPRRTAPLMAAAAAVTALAVPTAPVWAPLARFAAPAVLAAVFLICLGIGLSIGVAFGTASAAYIALAGSVPVAVLPTRMEAGVEGFVLLAVPLFILVGSLMNSGGISERLVAFLRALVGHIRGGLGLVLVAGMYLFSGISGSKTADMAALGPVLVPYMVRRGYSRGDGVAILSAAAAMGETIPPSIAILIIASITGLSTGALFVAGLLPALLTAAALGAAVGLRAWTRRQPVDPPATAGQIGRRLGGAALPLMLPAILFGGILAGAATPTEVSGIAVVYGLAVVVAYRTLRARDLWRICVESAATTGAIMLILSTANVLTWIPAAQGLGDSLVRWLTSTAGGPLLFLALTVALLIVMGSVMEGFPALILFAPVLLPIGVRLGLAPLHYAIVLVIAMGVGVFTPPLGVGLYIACSICRATLEETVREYAPYYAILVAALTVIACVPWITLMLPRTLHLSTR